MCVRACKIFSLPPPPCYSTIGILTRTLSAFLFLFLSSWFIPPPSLCFQVLSVGHCLSSFLPTSCSFPSYFCPSSPLFTLSPKLFSSLSHLLLLGQQELQTFIDTANAPIFGIDAHGKVNEWNNKVGAYPPARPPPHPPRSCQQSAA